MDAEVFSSRVVSSTAAARRTLWLRVWQADYQSKVIVTAYPFQGDRLFDESVDRIFAKTHGKNKLLDEMKKGTLEVSPLVHTTCFPDFIKRTEEPHRETLDSLSG